MDSQIEQLPDLTGYLKFASRPAWRRVELAAPRVVDPEAIRAEARTAWSRSRGAQGLHGQPAKDERTATRSAGAAARDFD